MKNIFTILSEIGVEIPEEKRQEFDEAVKANYKTVNEVTGLNTRLENLQTKYNNDIATRDNDLEDLRKQLTDATTNTQNIEEINNKFTALQKDYEVAKTEYENKLKSQQYEFLVKEQVNGINFSSNSAKETFIRHIMDKNLSVEGGKLLGFDDYVNQYKQEDAGAFIVEEPSKEEPKPTPSFVQKTTQIEDPQPKQKEIPVVW